MKPRAGRRHYLNHNGKRIATLVPVSNRFEYKSHSIEPESRYILSRFAYCRREGDAMTLESPLSHARLVLNDTEAAACISALRSPCRAVDLPLTQKSALQFLEFLQNTGAISRVDEKDEIAEDQDTALISWEFHDLLFHSRSRVGRHSNPYGRTNRHSARIETPPIVKPKMSKNNVDLYKPDLELLEEIDAPFTRVLEQRRSERKHGRAAITNQELGEFLFRSARVRKVFTTNKTEFTNRVYPCSGASYELEVYLAIHRCKGIARGLYHYDPLRHQLCRLSAPDSSIKQMLKSAAATARTNLPQVLIIVSARFQRINLRYASMAYAAILKDVGVLYQTFYLVATVMKLSACALGVGNSDLFSEAAGLNYYAETSVGEFLLGSQR